MPTKHPPWLQVAQPGLPCYLLAVALAGLAVAVRAVLETIAPGIAYLVVLCPIVVIAGVFLGTAPGVVTAATGLVAIGLLFLNPALTAWPPINPTQLDVLVFFPTCGAVLWATHTLRRREDTIRASLDTQALLMREADHRIKNSLQLVASVLRLQSTRAKAPEAREALDAAIARVTAVADAHRALQCSADFRTMDIDEVLRDLSDRVALLNSTVTLTCKSETGLRLDADKAIPIAMIASELLTNALRHAFPLGTPGIVSLKASIADGAFQIVIADGGAGLPVSPMAPGLGTTVFAALAKQAGAVIKTESSPSMGTAVTLCIPLPAPAEPNTIAYASKGTAQVAAST